MSGLIWILTVWHPDCISERFFWGEKVDLKKSTDDKKKHAKLPSLQRVKLLVTAATEDILIFHYIDMKYQALFSSDFLYIFQENKTGPFIH